MIRKPNAFQKLLHRFVMIRPVTAFFAPRVHRLDQLILKWTKDKHSASEILGWPIIQLTTSGAKTNRPRIIPLIGLLNHEKIILIASNFGRENNPGWYYNLKAHPECDVNFNGRSGTYIARETAGEEYERYWLLATSFYAGYDMYKQRAAHRHIPILLLEPKK
jgi:deazaflavin-dependent oxidoreductase (nitroreductase family)